MTTIIESFIVNKDTTDFNNNSIIKKGTMVKGAFSGVMPNGEIRITTDKGQIINLKDLQSQNQPIVNEPVKYVASQDKEKIFWESLALKQSDFISAKVKGRFYLVIVLVASYFAYKKFKK